MCLKSWSTDYEQLLLEARLPSLKTRRLVQNLSHLYKIINKFTHPDAPVVQRKVPYRSRSINANTVCIPHANTATYQHSFYPKTLCAWNSLPEEVTSCTSVAGFKHHLKTIDI